MKDINSLAAMRLWMCIISFAFSSASAQVPASDELSHGQYQKILENSDPNSGEWAWARFFLVGDSEAYRAAKASHDKGDSIGSFIFLKCHRNGIGVRKDDSIKAKTNFDLRTRLEKQNNLNPLEAYIMAYLLPGDESGNIDPNQPPGNDRWIQLNASANAGFAQAMDEVGQATQTHDPLQSAGWYNKAAQAGLASAMRNLGFFFAVTAKNKNPDQALLWTTRAATLGDAQAMINLGVSSDKQLVEELTIETGRQWIDRAADSKHHLGYLEKGLALLTGKYGFAIDKKAGISLLQKAASCGDCHSLGKIAHFYAHGQGVDTSIEKAIEFSEAAYIQGDVSAARSIAQYYSVLTGPEPGTHQKKIAYWVAKTMPGESVEDQDIEKHLSQIDPFSLKIE